MRAHTYTLACTYPSAYKEVRRLSESKILGLGNCLYYQDISQVSLSLNLDLADSARDVGHKTRDPPVYPSLVSAGVRNTGSQAWHFV